MSAAVFMKRSIFSFFFDIGSACDEYLLPWYGDTSLALLSRCAMCSYMFTFTLITLPILPNTIRSQLSITRHISYISISIFFLSSCNVHIDPLPCCPSIMFTSTIHLWKPHLHQTNCINLSLFMLSLPSPAPCHVFDRRLMTPRIVAKI